MNLRKLAGEREGNQNPRGTRMEGRWEWAAPDSDEDELFDGGEGPYPGHAQDDDVWEEGAGVWSGEASSGEAGTADAGEEGAGKAAAERQREQEEAFAILQRLSPTSDRPRFVATSCSVCVIPLVMVECNEQ